jgi:hypothetical protein
MFVRKENRGLSVKIVVVFLESNSRNFGTGLNYGKAEGK